MINENIALQSHNTFGVAVHTRWYSSISNTSQLSQFREQFNALNTELLLLGSGSNILFTQNYPGCVLQLNTNQIEITTNEADHCIVRAEAGCHWHDVVSWTLQHGLNGLENLSWIPGLAGAAPIQNIGAYGVELQSVISDVETYDLITDTYKVWKNIECDFSYRNSIFKSPDIKKRFIITAINMRLSRQASLQLHYTGICEELACMGISHPTASDVSQAVIHIRQRKLPDPHVLGNAGSFFKNPIVSLHQAQALQRQYPTLPVYPTHTELIKLPAAWFIEQAGLKGFREGDAGIAPQHALVLVNYGHASGQELWQLAQKVQHKVQHLFGVWLEPEPLIL